jgi:hypothetical protein
MAAPIDEIVQFLMTGILLSSVVVLFCIYYVIVSSSSTAGLRHDDAAQFFSFVFPKGSTPCNRVI